MDLELSCDHPAPGLRVWQPRRGFRYGVEAYLVAHFALMGGTVRSAVDLGCGSGIIGLLLASQGVAVELVERDPRWLALISRSLADSGRSLPVHAADVRAWRGGPFDLAISNPPWFDPTQPTSGDEWKANARAMRHGTVADFVRAGLSVAPRFCIVTRPERAADAVIPGVYLARQARVGEQIWLGELRAGSGQTQDEDILTADAYQRFRGR